MVVNCCVRDCKNKGRFRVKHKLNEIKTDYVIGNSIKVPRICEVHYNEYIQEGVPENDTEFTEVEYLDEYYKTHNSDSSSKTVSPFHSNILSKLLLVIWFVFTILNVFFQNIIDRCNENNLEKINQLEKENHSLKLNAKTQKIKLELQSKKLAKTDQKFSETIKKLNHENHLLKFSSQSVVIKCERQAKNIYKSISKIFNDDQIDMLYNNSSRGKKWSDKTILKSLQTKFACKTSGYNHLINEGFPNPSLRTLRRRFEGLNFKPGILDEVFTFLKAKVQQFNEHEKECYLVIDEMSIFEGKQYNVGTDSYIGEITLPLAKSKDSVVATHALAFMLVGLSSRYKQIVAYHFTGNSVNATNLQDVIFAIVKKAWSVGLYCNGIASDMGGSNSSLWRLWEIKAKRNGIKNFIPHPCDPSRKFYIIADVPHLIKRIVQGIMNNHVVIFDDCIVKSYDLTNNRVRSEDFFELFDQQKDDDLKLAPKLKHHILSPNNFQKMNVPVSTNLIGANISTSLLFLFSELKPSEQKQSTYHTTAWFCQILTRWFKLMTSRHVAISINKTNYNDVADELNEVSNIIKHAKFGSGIWKPFQKGLLVSTKSMLELSSDLIKRNFDYVLPGRTTTDCIENLFSTVRSDNSKPNALQVAHSLKNITVSEYLSPIQMNNTCYDIDDSKYLGNFLKIIQEARALHDLKKIETMKKDQSEVNRDDLDISTVSLNTRERNVLYKIACFLLYKISISRFKLSCDICLSACRSEHADDRSYSVLMRAPNLQYNSKKYVFYVNNDLFIYFEFMEKIFRIIHPKIISKGNVNRLITKKILDFGYDCCGIKNCHGLIKTITKRFVLFRLKNAGIQRQKKRSFDFSSHSMN